MEITANAVQTVTNNQNILFASTPVKGTKCIVHRDGSGLVTLRGITSGQCTARFLVMFSGNIAVPSGGTVGSISLSITIDGEPVQSSTMISTPSAVLEFDNVSSAMYITVPQGTSYTVSVENTSTQPISVQNANLIVTRVA